MILPLSSGSQAQSNKHFFDSHKNLFLDNVTTMWYLFYVYLLIRTTWIPSQSRKTVDSEIKCLSAVRCQTVKSRECTHCCLGCCIWCCILFVWLAASCLDVGAGERTPGLPLCFAYIHKNQQKILLWIIWKLPQFLYHPIRGTGVQIPARTSIFKAT